MRASIFLVISKNGDVRTRKMPSFDLNPNEVAFQLQIQVPDEAFAPRPVPVVVVDVPADAVRRQIGAHVELAAVPMDEEEATDGDTRI